MNRLREPLHLIQYESNYDRKKRRQRNLKGMIIVSGYFIVIATIILTFGILIGGS
jgi:hypothetical protein